MNTNPQRKNFLLLELLVYGLTALYFVFKILHFIFFDYSLDIYSCLQLSRDWAHNKPLMYENLFGPFANQHNAFIMLLFFPLTEFIGCYGFFIVQFLVWIYTLSVVFKLLSRQSIPTKVIVFFVLLLGPVAYYQYDDPLYGFNPELFFVPFVICLANAIIHKNKWQIILWYVLIILVREDGIVLATCVHVMIYYLQPGNPDNVFKTIWKEKRIVIIGLLIFIAGILRMFLLKENNTSRMACIQYDLTVLTPQQLLNFFVPDVSKAMLLIISAFVILFMVLPVKKKFLGVLLLLLPMISSNMAASIFNFSHETGSAFAPRISYVYGALVCSVLIILSQQSFDLPPATAAATTTILVILQYWSLHYVRKYDYFKNSFALISGNHKSQEEMNKIQQMKNLAFKLEYNFPIEIPWKYFKAFDKQDICFPERSFNAYKSPIIIITEKNNPLEKSSPPYPDMLKFENNDFIFYFAKEVDENIFRSLDQIEN